MPASAPIGDLPPDGENVSITDATGTPLGHYRMRWRGTNSDDERPDNCGFGDLLSNAEMRVYTQDKSPFGEFSIRYSDVVPEARHDCRYIDNITMYYNETFDFLQCRNVPMSRELLDGLAHCALINRNKPPEEFFVAVKVFLVTQDYAVEQRPWTDIIKKPDDPESPGFSLPA